MMQNYHKQINDIALIRIHEDVRPLIDNTIRAAEISSRKKRVIIGQNMTFAGWGLIHKADYDQN